MVTTSDETFSGVSKELDPQTLMAAASAECGLDDFGDESFVEPFTKWMQAAVSEARLPPPGVMMLAMVIRGWLVNRLRFEDDVKRHPEILDEPIRNPMFVTGMPRTGTTKVQRVLALDPQVQSLPFWQIANIAPIPGGPTGGPDPRIAMAEGFLAQVKEHYPDFLTAHPAFVDEPEEESFVIETTFESQANCTRLRTPSYWAWLKDRPTRERLDYLHRVLQYVQWQNGGVQRRGWVLKSGLHVGNLEQLFAVFPDASVIHTYRDPRVALPSICRITEVWRRMTTEEIDLPELGAEMVEVWSGLIQRHFDQRDRMGSDRILDIAYDEINTDITRVAGQVYAHLGRDLTPDMAERIAAWEAQHPQHQFGRHEYSLERYGLTAEGLEDAFAVYIDRLGVTPEMG